MKKFFDNTTHNSALKMEAKEPSFEIFPVEIIILILNYLSKKDIISASCVSKTWLGLTSHKSVLHHFYHKSTGWSQRDHAPSGLKFSQISYEQKRIDPDLKQIVINFFKDYNTICFQFPKNQEDFKEKLKRQSCTLIPVGVGFFKTKNYSEALLALQNSLPTKLLTLINKDLEEGNSLIKQHYNTLKK